MTKYCCFTSGLLLTLTLPNDKIYKDVFNKKKEGNEMANFWIYDDLFPEMNDFESFGERLMDFLYEKYKEQNITAKWLYEKIEAVYRYEEPNAEKLNKLLDWFKERNILPSQKERDEIEKQLKKIFEKKIISKATVSNYISTSSTQSSPTYTTDGRRKMYLFAYALGLNGKKSKEFFETVYLSRFASRAPEELFYIFGLQHSPDYSYCSMRRLLLYFQYAVEKLGKNEKSDPKKNSNIQNKSTAYFVEKAEDTNDNLIEFFNDLVDDMPNFEKTKHRAIKRIEELRNDLSRHYRVFMEDYDGIGQDLSQLKGIGHDLTVLKDATSEKLKAKMITNPEIYEKAKKARDNQYKQWGISYGNDFKPREDWSEVDFEKEDEEDNWIDEKVNDNIKKEFLKILPNVENIFNDEGKKSPLYDTLNFNEIRTMFILLAFCNYWFTEKEESVIAEQELLTESTSNTNHLENAKKEKGEFYTSNFNSDEFFEALNVELDRYNFNRLYEKNLFDKMILICSNYFPKSTDNHRNFTDIMSSLLDSVFNTKCENLFVSLRLAKVKIFAKEKNN